MNDEDKPFRPRTIASLDTLSKALAISSDAMYSGFGLV